MRLLGWIDKGNLFMGKVASVLVWAGAAILVWEVVARYVLGAPTVWAHGYTQRVFAAYFILIGAFTMIRGGHVRVDLFIGASGTRRRAALDIVNCSFLLIWASALTWQGWLFLEDALLWDLRDDSALGHRMWPIKACLFAGAAMILLQGLAELARSIIGLIDPSAIRRAEGDSA